jgi:hypothetical protein
MKKKWDDINDHGVQFDKFSSQVIQGIIIIILLK